MQFEVSQSRLLAALTRAQSVADHRSTAPVLANVLIDIHDGALRCRSSDSIVSLTEIVETNSVKPSSKQEAIAVKAKDIARVVKAMPPTLSITMLPDEWLELKGKGSEVKLKRMSADDFPRLPEPEASKFVQVSAHALVSLIDKTLFSVSTDEARVNLNGALLESNGKTMLFVSTDGHRMTKCSAEIVGPVLESPIVIPRAGLLELKRLAGSADGECGICVHDRHLFLRTGIAMISVKLSNVTFPPWQQVVPKSHTSSARVNRHELVLALRQAVVIAPSQTSTVRLAMKPQEIELSADNPELGGVKLSVEAEYSGDSIELGINGGYMLELLAACASETVEIRLQAALDAVVVVPISTDPVGDATPIDLVGVCMPMRL